MQGRTFQPTVISEECPPIAPSITGGISPLVLKGSEWHMTASTMIHYFYYSDPVLHVNSGKGSSKILWYLFSWQKGERRLVG